MAQLLYSEYPQQTNELACKQRCDGGAPATRRPQRPQPPECCLWQKAPPPANPPLKIARCRRSSPFPPGLVRRGFTNPQTWRKKSASISALGRARAAWCSVAIKAPFCSGGAQHGTPWRRRRCRRSRKGGAANRLPPCARINLSAPPCAPHRCRHVVPLPPPLCTVGQKAFEQGARSRVRVSGGGGGGGRLEPLE